MTEKGVEAGDVSVDVNLGIEHGVEENGVGVIEVGLDCNGKGDVHNDGNKNGSTASGKDDSDDSYVFVSGSHEMVEDGAKGGNNVEFLEESNDTKVLEDSIMAPESRKDEIENLEKVPHVEIGEAGKSSYVVENGVSLFSKDGAEDPMAESDGDDNQKKMVNEIETFDEESELGIVENDLKAEESIKIDYSIKLENVQEAVNAAPYDHKSNSQLAINAVVENQDANLEVSDPGVEEKLDSEIETTKSNESERIAEEVKKEADEESSVDKKEKQETEAVVSGDALVDLMELKQAQPVDLIDESLSDKKVIDESLSDKKVIDDKEPQLSEEEIKLDNKSEPSLDVQENKNCESSLPVDESDFNREKRNHSTTILPLESNAEFAYEAFFNEHDDLQCREIVCAKVNKGNNIDYVASLDEIGKPEVASTVSKEVHLNSKVVEGKGLEFETQMEVNDYQNPEAEQPTSKDILLNSVDQDQELANDINDGLHSDLRAECVTGPSHDGFSQDLADDIELVAPDTNTRDSGVPTDNEWPELSCYNTKKKINTKSNSDAHGSQECENIVSEEMNLADQGGNEFQNVGSEDDNHVGHEKEVGDASLSKDNENAYPDSGTGEEINHTSQSITGADDQNHADSVSSPSILHTCSQSISDGAGSAVNLENEVVMSESGDKDNETKLDGNLEAPKIGSSPSPDEDVSLTESQMYRRPFFFLIKVPRFEDDHIRKQIKFAQQELDEKTKLRDSYKVLIQAKKAVCQEFNDDLEAAKLEEKVARDNLKAKRREIDAAQAVIDKVNNAMMVEDIAVSIRNMEHVMQHETVSLSEEKQLMREIKRLKHFREQLSSSIGTQDELQEALDQKDRIKDHLKSLKRELDSIRSNVQRTDTATKAAKKKCFEEFAELNKLHLEFRAADGVRQEAYMSLVSLRRELAQKNKLFRMYKDNEKAANDYALSGDKEVLHSLCVNQVEMVMEMWHTNDEFRRNYVKCNARSTLRRLKTLDGRSLGLDEEPPSLTYVRNDRFLQSQVVTSQFPSLEQSKLLGPPVAEKVIKEPIVELLEKKEARNPSKATAIQLQVSTASCQELTHEAKEEVKRSKEEEELAKKVEEKRKKEEEAKMMEQLRLEEKAKAKEALERKKRMAEKAQARAELRAKKEAEQREKEREKRLRKKEKRKSPEGAEEDFEDRDFMAASGGQAEVTKATEKAVTVSKRHHKQSHYPKVTKTNVMPLPLRNRGRRKMQMWMWIGVSSLAAVAVVLLGIWYISSLVERERIRY